MGTITFLLFMGSLDAGETDMKSIPDRSRRGGSHEGNNDGGSKFGT